MCLHLCELHVTGDYHTCAQTTGGGGTCFGYGGHGQLGYGHTSTIGDNEHPSSAGIVDLGDDVVVQVAVGFYHSCVTTSSGTARCWG